jgi:hypothetical protein
LLDRTDAEYFAWCEAYLERKARNKENRKKEKIKEEGIKKGDNHEIWYKEM